MREPERKITLLDAMILIAALAMAIAWTRVAGHEIYERANDGVPPGVRFPLLARVQWWVPIPVPALATFSAAHLLMRFRRPRPRLRCLSRQPGSVASICIMAAFGTQLVLLPIGYGLKQIPGMVFRGTVMSPPIQWAIMRSSTDLGLAVLGGWLVLSLRRGWRPESTWLDRSGRLLGTLWIVQFLIQRTTGLMLMT